MKKIRVCFFSFNAYPLFNPNYAHIVHGGAEVDTYFIAREIAKDPDFDVYFIVGDFGQPKRESYEGVVLCRTFAIRHDFKYLRYPHAALLLLNLCDQINADVYFQESAGIVSGLIAFYCRVAGKKFVFRTAHDNHCNGEFIRNRPLAGLFYRYALSNVDCIITQTASHQSDLRRSMGLESTVINNAHPIPRKPHKKSRRYILWVGRLVEQKRPLIFLELARSFPDEHFVMIGSGDSKYIDAVKQKAENLPNFDYLSQVPFNKIDKYFRDAKIFVSTSSSEGFPNTFIQAAVNSTPILSLSVDPNGVLSKERVGYCCKGSARFLKEFLKDYLDRPNAQRAYQKGSYEYACKHHDLKVISERYKALFRCTDNGPSNYSA